MFKKTLIAAAFAVAATGSFAQVYVQGAIGKGNVNGEFANATSTNKSSSGNKFGIGYQLGNGWAVEGNSINYGKTVSSTATAGAEVKVSGYGIGGVYSGGNGPWEFRLGLALNQNTAKSAFSGTAIGVASSESSSQLNVDIGAAYKVTENVSLTVGYDSSSSKFQGQNVSVSLMSIGLRAKF